MCCVTHARAMNLTERSTMCNFAARKIADYKFKCKNYTPITAPHDLPASTSTTCAQKPEARAHALHPRTQTVMLSLKCLLGTVDCAELRGTEASQTPAVTEIPLFFLIIRQTTIGMFELHKHA